LRPSPTHARDALAILIRMNPTCRDETARARDA
jgi:hypothetical protein